MLPQVLIFMGVSGCGKTAVGREVARRSGARFVDADNLHPPENIAKMTAGIPLTDEDREPWLASVIREARSSHSIVLACSALRRTYRERIREGVPAAWFVYLQGSQELIFARISTRQGHYMKAGLLESQFAILEEPREEAQVLKLSIVHSITSLADQTIAAFS